MTKEKKLPIVWNKPIDPEADRDFPKKRYRPVTLHDLTLRRANYHDYLRTGYYSARDYRRLFAALKKARFQGTISLHLAVKEPDIKELKKERAYLKRFI